MPLIRIGICLWTLHIYIFRVTGHLCGEFTGPRWIPTQGPVTRSFDVLFDLRRNKRVNNREAGENKLTVLFVFLTLFFLNYSFHNGYRWSSSQVLTQSQFLSVSDIYLFDKCFEWFCLSIPSQQFYIHFATLAANLKFNEYHISYISISQHSRSEMIVYSVSVFFFLQSADQQQEFFGWIYNNNGKV